MMVILCQIHGQSPKNQGNACLKKTRGFLRYLGEKVKGFFGDMDEHGRNTDEHGRNTDEHGRNMDGTWTEHGLLLLLSVSVRDRL